MLNSNDMKGYCYESKLDLDKKDAQINPELVYFRKNINLTTDKNHGQLNISADSRYKLYINGQLVEVGPLKGDAKNGTMIK